MTPQSVLIDWLLALGWALVGALSMAIALAILLWLFDRLTPIKQWEKIEEGNIAVAIVLAAVIIAFSLVVASAVKLI